MTGNEPLQDIIMNIHDPVQRGKMERRIEAAMRARDLRKGPTVQRSRAIPMPIGQIYELDTKWSSPGVNTLLFNLNTCTYYSLLSTYYLLLVTYY